jgi:glycosyltransferase involved in cell wall biosynthesis
MLNTMKIVILTIALVQGDAIGNDIFYEYQSLKDNGFDVYLYAEQYDSFYVSLIINNKKLNQLITSKENIVIYHHGIFWEHGGRIIDRAECKFILKYHNITPCEFFTDYNTIYYNDSYKGRKQTEQFINSNKILFYLADSKFNAQEIETYGVSKEKIFIMPPFTKIHSFDSTESNLKLYQSLQDGKVNLLSVGRTLPHKGFHHMINILKQYISYYGDNIRLNIIGSIELTLEKYLNEIQDLIWKNHLESYVCFKGKVSFADLKTYYKASHLLLIMSEHEGFCLPIIEAQYNNLPVIALDRCAVKDTIGMEQLLFRDIDYQLFAAAIYTISNNANVKDYLTYWGYQNCLQFRNEKLSEKFINVLSENL